MASHFYNKVEHKIDSMESFKKVAVAPSELPGDIFASVGRCVLRDVGGTAIGMRLGVSLLPYNALAHLIALVAPVPAGLQAERQGARDGVELRGLAATAFIG